MTKNIKAYEKYLEEKFNHNIIDRQDLTNHRAQIAYLQHERYIHLLVTSVVSIILFLIFMLCLFQDNLLLYLLLIILMLLDIFYVRHYYVLENTIQHWYRMETEIIEKIQNME